MNITKLTEKYIESKPSIKDCLKKDMVNFSKLARTIIKENKLKNNDFDAVLIACRRYKRKLKKEFQHEEQILDLLKKTKISLKTKIAVIVLEKTIFFNNLIEIGKKIKKTNEEFHMFEGPSSITVITSQEFLPEIKKTFKNSIIKINKDLVAVILKSPENIENLPGVVAFTYSLLADNSVNLVESMSCWTDTIFVVNEKQIAKVMEVLRF